MTSITNLSNELTFEIFKFLNNEDLNNLYLSNKNTNYDINKYSNIFLKKNWKEYINEKKCINCKSICDNLICDNCITDTCWNCFKKVGSENLTIKNDKDNNLIFCCINKCKYNCNKCDKIYNKKFIIKKNWMIYCNYCLNNL
jgi:hypothetical protein